MDLPQARAAEGHFMASWGVSIRTAPPTVRRQLGNVRPSALSRLQNLKQACLKPACYVSYVVILQADDVWLNNVFPGRQTCTPSLPVVSLLGLELESLRPPLRLSWQMRRLSNFTASAGSPFGFTQVLMPSNALRPGKGQQAWRASGAIKLV